MLTTILLALPYTDYSIFFLAQVFCVVCVSWSVAAESARTLSKHASKETNSNKPRTNEEVVMWHFLYELEGMDKLDRGVLNYARS
jgi:hypothetical protein